MTATDPRVHVACRALADAMGAPNEWRYFEVEARLVIAAADAVDPLREGEHPRVELHKAWNEGHHAGVLNATGEYGEPLHDNPYPITQEA